MEFFIVFLSATNIKQLFILELNFLIFSCIFFLIIRELQILLKNSLKKLENRLFFWTKFLTQIINPYKSVLRSTRGIRVPLFYN